MCVCVCVCTPTLTGRVSGEGGKGVVGVKRGVGERKSVLSVASYR